MAFRKPSLAFKDRTFGHGSEGQHTFRDRPAQNVDSTNLRTKGKGFVRIVTRFAEKTSMQGVPYINSAKLWWAKLLWGILLGCALVATGLHLWYLCNQYYGYPKLTKIDLGFNNLEFPALTICNVNQIHKGRLEAAEGLEELQQLAEDLEPDTLISLHSHNIAPHGPPAQPPGSGPGQPGQGPGPPGQGNVPNIPPGKRRRKRFDPYSIFNQTVYGPMPPDGLEPPPRPNEYNGTTDTFSVISETFSRLYLNVDRATRARLGHNITDMLKSCTFNNKDCPAKLFKLHQTSKYGNCYTLSSPKFIARLSGPSQGLSLTIYLETLNYLKGLSHGYGARLHIHRKDTYPDPSNEGINLAGAMETSIGLRMTTISRLGHPYGQCEDGVEFEKMYNVTYTRQTCQTFCVMSKMIESCHCYSGAIEEMALLRNSSLSPCSTNEEIACETKITEQYTWKEFDCHCENPCTEMQWSNTISQRQWPTDEYAVSINSSSPRIYFYKYQRIESRIVVPSYADTAAPGTCIYTARPEARVSAIMNRKCSSIWSYTIRNGPITVSHCSCQTSSEILLNDVCGLKPDNCYLSGDDSRLLNLNFLKLNVYYEELNYQNITETPEIETAQFVSDVGGALGLWIGLSILSMCELLQLFAELCNYGIHKTFLSNRRRKLRRRSRPPMKHPSLFVTDSGPYATPNEETGHRPYSVLRREDSHVYSSVKSHNDYVFRNNY